MDDLEIVILSEVSSRQKDKYHMILWNLKKRGGTNELIYETEVDSWM